MELPTELSKPPPRDPAGAGTLLKKNRGLVRTLFIGGPVTFVAVLIIFWLKFDELNTFAFVAAAGISGLVELFAVAMRMQAKRALRLYCEGTATVGKVIKVQSPGDRQGNAYVFIDVEFKNGRGEALAGKVSTIGKEWDVDTNAGTEVPVLYIDGAPLFAIYTPRLGMSVGRLK